MLLCYLPVNSVYAHLSGTSPLCVIHSFPAWSSTPNNISKKTVAYKFCLMLDKMK